ncbi:MAG: ComEC/Rec2 family competence protein [Microcoleaceae cyanobacterium]
MAQTIGLILGLAYLCGLLATSVAGGQSVVLGLGVLLALVIGLWQQQWQVRYRAQLRRQRLNNGADTGRALPNAALKAAPPIFLTLPITIWLIAGLVAVVASFYLQVRMPQPTAQDISQLVLQGSNAQDTVVTVRGEVTSAPRITRSGRAQFWLRATQVNEITGNDQPIAVSRDVTGKVYVTVPILQATGLHPNALLAVTGNLYQPQPPINPGGFDFATYLARQGAFAGLKGRYLSFQSDPSAWGLWKLRRKMVQAQVTRLGVPEGAVLSAMVLGRRAVDLPYDIRDQFVQVGLAHTLAASGFHVSLLLGLVLALVRRGRPWLKFGLGTLTLLSYVGLTGGSPSVLRAALMGTAALVALLAERKVRPLNVLLGVAILLLIINPLWIWDLGFQLSFLATLGLLVTVPAIVNRLNWMPPVLATSFAVPLAASIWTLPLQLYAFHVLSPYSIVVNLLTAPLITVLTLGGMVSAMAALILPVLGGAVAGLLYYPLQALIGIVGFFNQLSGNSIAVGEIELIQLVALYSIIGWVWWQSSRQATLTRRRRSSIGLYAALETVIRWIFRPTLVGFAMATLMLAIPVWYTRAFQFQATVLATPGEPILVIQDRGNTTLVNSGSQNTAQYVVLPFLKSQGVNQIRWSVATHSGLGLSIGWPTILEQMPIVTFYDNPSSKQTYYVSNQVIQDALVTRQVDYEPLTLRETTALDSTQVQLLNSEVPVVQLMIGDQRWMLLGDVDLDDQILLAQKTRLPRVQVLWWSGAALKPKFLQVLQPQVAIASSNSIDPDTAEQLRRNQVQVFWTGRDGALQWTPKRGFETTLGSDETDGAFL